LEASTPTSFTDQAKVWHANAFFTSSMSIFTFIGTFSNSTFCSCAT